jgi:outer membrane protein assembly factor BamB
MKKHPFIPILILTAALFLSACTGGVTASSWPGLNAGTDLAYLADGQFVYAVRLSDGQQAWRYPEKAEARRTFYASPILTEDGQLLVSSFDKSLFSLNPQSGAVNWSFLTGDRLIGSPLVDGDTIYLPSADYTMYALDLRGNLKWKFKTGNALWAMPSADADHIYFTSMDHSLYAVNKNNGSKLWSVELGAASVGTPSLSEDGKVYLGTLEKEMLAVDAASGRILWRTPTDSAIWSGPAVNADGVYFGDLSGKFYALNPETGAILWSAQPDGAIVGTPVITETGLVFGTESGSLVNLDFSGSQVWKREIGGKLYTTPLLSGNRYLAAVTQGDKLLAFVDENGNQVWGFVPPK